MTKKSNQFIEEQKKSLDVYLAGIFAEYSTQFQDHETSEALFTYLQHFYISGKSIRGSLFLQGLELFSPTQTIDKTSHYPIAAALEVLHSLLLIQDDFMDQDRFRRNLPALYATFENQAKENEFNHIDRYVASSIMCATDICFFIAIGELNKISTKLPANVLQTTLNEYIHVGFSQWKDVEVSHQTKTASPQLKTIKQIYKYKTARYTFTMPMVLAAQITGLNASQQKSLDVACEHLGMVYQITDDWLNIFGDSKKTGKPIASDIIENKKTLYRYFFLKALKLGTFKKFSHLSTFFGKSQLSSTEIEEVKSAFIVTNTVSTLKSIITDYEKRFYVVIEQSTLSNETKKFLSELFQYIKQREK